MIDYSNGTLGTYSNLYNHPVIIDDFKGSSNPKIELSKKSGLPLGVLSSKQNFGEDEDEEEDEDDGSDNEDATRYVTLSFSFFFD
jgi:hypothetical protein